MNIRLLRIPKTSPITSDESASLIKLRMIVNGVVAVKSSFYNSVTVLNRIILTMSLKTPSP